MTRFQILALLEKYPACRCLPDIVAIAAREGYWKRTLPNCLRTQVPRLVYHRLLTRYWKPWKRRGDGRYGQHVYTITRRGRERLAWARDQGLI